MNPDQNMWAKYLVNFHLGYPGSVNQDIVDWFERHRKRV
jgi:hypothetical protein